MHYNENIFTQTFERGAVFALHHFLFFTGSRLADIDMASGNKMNAGRAPDLSLAAWI